MDWRADGRELYFGNDGRHGTLSHAAFAQELAFQHNNALYWEREECARLAEAAGHKKLAAAIRARAIPPPVTAAD